MTKQYTRIFGLFSHHVEPRFQFFVSREESFPIPLKYIDVIRSTHTDLDVAQEKRIDDSKVWSGERLTKIQATSRPDHITRWHRRSERQPVYSRELHLLSSYWTESSTYVPREESFLVSQDLHYWTKLPREEYTIRGGIGKAKTPDAKTNSVVFILQG